VSQEWTVFVDYEPKVTRQAIRTQSKIHVSYTQHQAQPQPQSDVFFDCEVPLLWLRPRCDMWRRAGRYFEGDILTDGLSQHCNSKALHVFGAKAVIELGCRSKAVVNILPSDCSVKSFNLSMALVLERWYSRRQDRYMVFTRAKE